MHEVNTLWTIKVEDSGMTFYITNITFQSIANSAAKGIQQDNPKAIIKIFFAQDTTQNRAN